MDVISIALANQKFDNMSGVNCVYVSKKGNDANDGSIGSPKLTIQTAITAAAEKVNSNNPQAAVIVLDAGRYEETITMQDNVLLFAEQATIIGRINIRNNCKVSIYAHYASENGQTMLYKDGTAHAYYRTVISDGRGINGNITGTSNIYNITASSILFTEVELMFVSQNGIGVRELSSTTGHIHFLIKDLYLSGNNARGIYAQGTASNLIGKVDHILETGTPSNTTAIQVNNADCIVKVTVEEITADMAYNIAAGSLYLNCPKITGSVIGTPKFLPASKSDVEEQKIKIAKVEKELGDYQKTISQININMEAKQKVSGYGVVNLPKTAANGQVSSISVKGITRRNEFNKEATPTTKVNSEVTVLPTGIKVTTTSDGTNRQVAYNLDLEPNTQYIVSCITNIISGATQTSAGSIRIMDRTYTNSLAWKLKTQPSATFTTPSDGKISVIFYATQSLSESGNVDYINLIVEKGNIVNSYISYGTKSTVCAMRLKSVNEGETEETIQYIIGKDQGTGEILELRSLPNGIKDEVRVSEGKLIKRVSDELILNGNLLWDSFSDASTNTYRMRLVNTAIDAVQSATDTGIGYCVDGNFSTRNSTTGYDERCIILANNNIYLRIEKSKVDAMTGVTVTDKFKAYLNQYPITLIYQLAEPIITPIEVSGNLISYPSGTIYVENAVADAGIYSDKFTILNTDLPIKEIEKISKVDFTTGIETELDVSQAVIATDKLSFTHPDLVKGDIVFTTYFYDVESTQGETEIEYYDSRHTIKDTQNGKFYQWKVSSTNGVPSIQLVEV